MSQRERVLALLRDAEWVCAHRWYSSGIPNARNRIAELRAVGFVIDSEPCPDEHGPGYFRYRLRIDPERQQRISEGLRQAKQLTLA